MKCADSIEARSVEESFINLDPIQAAGRLTPEAMKAVISWGDGYSVCDNCHKPFRLDYVNNPPIADFHEEVAKWLNMDQVQLVPGARRAFQEVTGALVGKGEPVIMTGMGHYTAYLSVEVVNGIVREIKPTPDHHITADAAAVSIENATREFGYAPKLVFVDAVDFMYGNFHEVKEIAKVARQYDIPVIYNGAYTVGVLPVDGKKLGVDFVVGSGHKSMSAPAPSGILATTTEYADIVLRTTRIQGDVTGRKFGIKQVGILGCSLMGAPVVGLIASFPAVKERVNHFDEQLKNHKIVTDALLSIEGTKVASEYPRKHTMTRMDTTESFDRIAQIHRKRGFFLSSALGKRGITGIMPGVTKQWKFNTYGLTTSQAEYLADSFIEIAEENSMVIG
ncbi:MAG: aminotransferase class V-fold PLP-dependent enzyme [Methanocorpusculum sp.]|jgi:Sep-tRNA:Cys-tRNA synthetase|nr:aminotransferase class V-fold PLP-dependent enzyme [Methanocorpusculum sp.]MDD2470425.1 aminotransferase class V-fold PLP-dependent enzyme [Methanocorpusculum sp.]MDD3257137.1 aminotransferase class V-fold PLP-dependent enzyme [Methanocorpusculum sp.]MDD4132513.1 aminotransferase class V-fold PLP-dependent enzyme [Methanocorpusculum sp.]